MKIVWALTVIDDCKQYLSVLHVNARSEWERKNQFDKIGPFTIWIKYAQTNANECERACIKFKIEINFTIDGGIYLFDFFFYFQMKRMISTIEIELELLLNQKSYRFQYNLSFVRFIIFFSSSIQLVYRLPSRYAYHLIYVRL